jgi:CheY-like chemotaxis protein
MTKQILIADDEESFRFAASLSLRQEGYVVTEASNGEEAFAKIMDWHVSGRHFDLIILDIQMPNITGTDLYEDLRGYGIDTPIVFVSGYADEHAMGLASQTGSSLLRKPFEAETMVNMVDLMIGMG